LPIALYAAFWFTYSRSGLLGLAVAMGTFLIFLGKENLWKNWRPLLLVGLVWLIISLLTFSSKIAFAATPSTEGQERGSPPSEPRSVTGSTVDIRLAVWKGTLNLIKNHPLLGTGPETFAYSFLPYRPVELNQTAEWEFLYNKAHNEYLNLAACTGLLGLTTYLLLVGKFIWWNTREFMQIKANERKCANERILRAGIFAGWMGVLVSDFFGFSVVTTSLLFWLFMALSISYIPVGDRTS
jgi:O-antigen ligase